MTKYINIISISICRVCGQELRKQVDANIGFVGRIQKQFRISMVNHVIYTSYPIIINQKHMNHTSPFLIEQLSMHKALSDSYSETSTEGDQFDINPPSHSTHHLSFYAHSNKIKTSLCKNYTEKGFCPYGQRCQFAHGPQELRINMQNNRCYKTKNCYAFVKKGYCYYGERCNFIHSQNNPESNEVEKWRQMYRNHREIIEFGRMKQASKLLTMLKNEEKQ